MDDRLEKALEHANYKATIAEARKNLRLKYRNDLLYSHNGGIFTASPGLISFLDSLHRNGQKDVVLIDDKENPVMIDNVLEFTKAVADVYFAASNAYQHEFSKLRKARNIKTVVGK